MIDFKFLEKQINEGATFALVADLDGEGKFQVTTCKPEHLKRLVAIYAIKDTLEEALESVIDQIKEARWW